MTPRLLAATASALMLVACASPGRYHSVYKIDNSPQLGRLAAAEEMAKLAAEGVPESGVPLAQSLKLLRSMPPVMPQADIEQGVVGSVTVEINFTAGGLTESVQIVQSTKASLAEAVTDAVSRWRIEPPSRNGKPVRLKVVQTFQFKTD